MYIKTKTRLIIIGIGLPIIILEMWRVVLEEL